MKSETIEINDKLYKVKVAETLEERARGLLEVKELPKDEGMLFIFDKPLTVGFWMKDTLIPLDIIFINEDMEVVSIYKGLPENSDIALEDNIKYVLELNQNSGVKEGDELDIEDNENIPTMKVIDSNGNTQMELEGGERIFSRKNTRTIIRMVRKANNTKLDSDYKRLGRKIFSYIKLQDNRLPEYVTLKDKEDKESSKN